MRKASMVGFMFFVSINLLLVAYSDDDGECRRSDMRMISDLLPRPPIEELEVGFPPVLFHELEHSGTNRFNILRYLDVLRYNRNMLDFASDNIRLVLGDAVGDALRSYLVENPKTRLPIVWTMMDFAENLTSGKFTRFLVRTFGGDIGANQITSPFEYSVTGLPLQDRDFSSHRVNFGLRPFEGDPYAFFGFSERQNRNEVLGIQFRVNFRDWKYLVPELVVKIPLASWSLGLGLRYQSEDSLELWRNRSEYQSSMDQKGFSYFLGFQGPFLGGQAFLGTGYPEALTVLYRRSF